MSPKVRLHSLRGSLGVLLGFCIPLILAGVTNGNTRRPAHASSYSHASLQTKDSFRVSDVDEREQAIRQALGWDKPSASESQQKENEHEETAFLILDEENEVVVDATVSSDPIDQLIAKNQKLLAELSAEYAGIQE